MFSGWEVLPVGVWSIEFFGSPERKLLKFPNSQSITWHALEEEEGR